MPAPEAEVEAAGACWTRGDEAAPLLLLLLLLAAAAEAPPLRGDAAAAAAAADGGRCKPLIKEPAPLRAAPLFAEPPADPLRAASPDMAAANGAPPMCGGLRCFCCINELPVCIDGGCCDGCCAVPTSESD